MDTSVRNKSFERNARNLASYRLKARKCDRLRCVVNNQVYARKGLDRPDVSSLTSYDPALHLVIGQRHYRDSSLGDLLGGKALDRQRNNVSSLVIGFFLKLLLIFHDLDGFFVSELVLKLRQQVALSLFGGIAGDLLEHFELALLKSLDLRELLVSFFELFVDLFFLFLDVIKLAVKGFFFLLDSAFLTLNFFASVGNFLLAFGSEPVDFVLALKNYLFLFSFGSLDSVRYDLLGFFLGAAYFFFGSAFADLNTKENTDCAADQTRSNNTDYRNG